MVLPPKISIPNLKKLRSVKVCYFYKSWSLRSDFILGQVRLKIGKYPRSTGRAAKPYAKWAESPEREGVRDVRFKLKIFGFRLASIAIRAQREALNLSENHKFWVWTYHPVLPSFQAFCQHMPNLTLRNFSTGLERSNDCLRLGISIKNYITLVKKLNLKVSGVLNVKVSVSEVNN